MATRDSTQYVINPATGRTIRVGGPTYTQLQTRGLPVAALRTTPHAPARAARTRHAEYALSPHEVARAVALGRATPVPLREELAPGTPPYLRRIAHSEMAREHIGQGERTRGWRVAAPQRGPERHELRAQCGDVCFLQPQREAFPICPKCRNGVCTCKVDCRGVLAAKIRARQYKYQDVARAAEQIERRLGCPHGRRRRGD